MPNNSIEHLGSWESTRALMAMVFPLFKGESLWIYLISTICRVVLINIVWLKSARPKVALYTKSWCTTCVYWYSLKHISFLTFWLYIKCGKSWKESNILQWHFYQLYRILCQRTAGKFYIFSQIVTCTISGTCHHEVNLVRWIYSFDQASFWQKNRNISLETVV